MSVRCCTEQDRVYGAAAESPPPAACALVNVVIVSTVSHDGLCGNQSPVCDVYNSYLPGRGDTMIKKVVHPGRGSAIALRLC